MKYPSRPKCRSHLIFDHLPQLRGWHKYFAQQCILHLLNAHIYVNPVLVDRTGELITVPNLSTYNIGDARPGFGLSCTHEGSNSMFTVMKLILENWSVIPGNRSMIADTGIPRLVTIMICWMLLRERALLTWSRWSLTGPRLLSPEKTNYSTPTSEISERSLFKSGKSLVFDSKMRPRMLPTCPTPSKPKQRDVLERWFRRLSLGWTLAVRMSLIRQSYFRLLILGESAPLKLPNE